MLVYLIGFMGVGKTTIGKRIANKIAYNFIDLDTFIENKYLQSVTSIFETKGENHFRSLELECVIELSYKKNCVIALGGGTPCYNSVISLLKQNGIVIYLQANTSFLESRLKKSKQNRPLINSLKDFELRKYIEDKLTERTPFYLQADVIVDAVNTNTEALSKIILDMQHHPLS